jgi:hypothetical protein
MIHNRNDSLPFGQLLWPRTRYSRTNFNFPRIFSSHLTDHLPEMRTTDQSNASPSESPNYQPARRKTLQFSTDSPLTNLAPPSRSLSQVSRGGAGETPRTRGCDFRFLTWCRGAVSTTGAASRVRSSRARGPPWGLPGAEGAAKARPCRRFRGDRGATRSEPPERPPVGGNVRQRD